MVRESLKVRTLIGVERFLFSILLRLVTPRSVPTLAGAFVPAHAMTFVRLLTVPLPPALITAFSPALPRTFVPALPKTFVPAHPRIFASAHLMTFVLVLTVALPPALPRTFALTATEPMAGNAYEKPVMPGEAPPDGNLVFAFIVRNQALFAGTALRRNPELFLRKLKVPRRRPHAPLGLFQVPPRGLLVRFEVQHLGTLPLPVTTNSIAVSSKHWNNRIERDGKGDQELFQ